MKKELVKSKEWSISVHLEFMEKMSAMYKDFAEQHERLKLEALTLALTLCLQIEKERKSLKRLHNKESKNGKKEAKPARKNGVHKGSKRSS